ncbi:hypothetical protein ACFXP3_13620 [Streptomyces sp. NPDC059096]|uniref:YqeB family protein n=1 Tax=Streptomyces sp. NPDC059096 TaxID=3346727 RepID=UPI00369FE46C
MSRELRRQPDPEVGGHVTVLREPVRDIVVAYVVFVLVGAGLGWLVAPLARWLTTLPWVPFQGPVELVASIPAPVLSAVGAVAGLVIMLAFHHQQLVIRLSDDRVVLIRKGGEQAFPRDAVAMAFRDGDQLVLLGQDTGELARHGCDLKADRVADAFKEHGYPWADLDPYRSEFRLWVPDTPGLSAGANAVLKARQEELDRGDSEDDVRDLREELARHGIVVRDEKGRQYWRAHEK